MRDADEWGTQDGFVDAPPAYMSGLQPLGSSGARGPRPSAQAGMGRAFGPCRMGSG